MASPVSSRRFGVSSPIAMAVEKSWEGTYVRTLQNHQELQRLLPYFCDWLPSWEITESVFSWQAYMVAEIVPNLVKKISSSPFMLDKELLRILHKNSSVQIVSDANLLCALLRGCRDVDQAVPCYDGTSGEADFLNSPNLDEKAKEVLRRFQAIKVFQTHQELQRLIPFFCEQLPNWENAEDFLSWQSYVASEIIPDLLKMILSSPFIGDEEKSIPLLKYSPGEIVLHENHLCALFHICYNMSLVAPFYDGTFGGPDLLVAPTLEGKAHAVVERLRYIQKNQCPLPVIHCYRGGMACVPEELCHAPALKDLKLDGNSIRVLPSALSASSELAVISLDRNKLSWIPEVIFSLPHLSVLSIAQNRLTAIPSGIKNLRDLSWVDLSGNSIKELPPEVGELSSLGYLDLSDTPVQSFPSQQMARLVSLVSLKLFHTSVESIPSEILNLPSLEKVFVSPNQLKSRPQDASKIAFRDNLYSR